MLRFASSVAVLAAVGVVLAGGSPAAGEKHAKPFPQVIQLPTGFRPEGIEVGRGTTFYVGSVANGAIYRGDLRTGNGADLHPRRCREGGDRHRARQPQPALRGRRRHGQRRTSTTPRPARRFARTASRTGADDVHQRRRRDAQRGVLHGFDEGGSLQGSDRARRRLGDAQTITLGGDYVHVAGQFNLNGIDATPNGKKLIAVQTAGGKLYRIDPATGVAKLIVLANGESVPNGDGILLDGKTLYVVQNQPNKVAVIKLKHDLARGRVVTRLGDSDFKVPTTIDDLGRRLYAVNARFGEPNPDTLDLPDRAAEEVER